MIVQHLEFNEILVSVSVDLSSVKTISLISDIQMLIKV